MSGLGHSMSMKTHHVVAESGRRVEKFFAPASPTSLTERAPVLRRCIFTAEVEQICNVHKPLPDLKIPVGPCGAPAVSGWCRGEKFFVPPAHESQNKEVHMSTHSESSPNCKRHFAVFGDTHGHLRLMFRLCRLWQIQHRVFLDGIL
jgi:hypothetical protein